MGSKQCAYTANILKIGTPLCHKHDMYWTAAWQNRQNDVRSAKTQISLGIPPVWSVSAVRMTKHWFLSYSLSAQWRLVRLGGCPGWSESSLSTQVILSVLSCFFSWPDQCFQTSPLNAYQYSKFILRDLTLSRGFQTALATWPLLLATYVWEIYKHPTY